MPFTIEEAAYHEAGHAVIAHLSGISTLENVDIITTGNNQRHGVTSTYNSNKVHGKLRARYESCVTAAAGYVAHRLYFLKHSMHIDEDALSKGAADDAAYISKDFGLGLEGEFMMVAQHRLSDKQAWAAVEALAEELVRVQSHSVKGIDAIRIINIHKPPQPAPRTAVRAGLFSTLFDRLKGRHVSP